MARVTRSSNKRKHEESQAKHIAETSEVGDSISRWIMTQTSARPDDFVAEDVLLRIMGKFKPGDERTVFLKRYHKLLTTPYDQQLDMTGVSMLHHHKILKCLGARDRLRMTLVNVALARKILDAEIIKFVAELKECA